MTYCGMRYSRVKQCKLGDGVVTWVSARCFRRPASRNNIPTATSQARICFSLRREITALSPGHA
jgi:hypothetical protein